MGTKSLRARVFKVSSRFQGKHDIISHRYEGIEISLPLVFEYPL